MSEPVYRRLKDLALALSSSHSALTPWNRLVRFADARAKSEHTASSETASCFAVHGKSTLDCRFRDGNRAQWTPDAQCCVEQWASATTEPDMSQREVNVVLLPLLRTQLEYWRGGRPRVADLEQIVDYMRLRRARGFPPLPFGFGPRRQKGARSDPKRLEASQTRKLRRTVDYVYRYVPFYRRAMDAAGVTPTDIHSLADMNKLPITYREQLEEDTEAFISHQPDLVPSSVSQTSGTTGKKLSVYLSTEEMRYYASTRAMGALLTGQLGPTDIVQINQALEGFLLEISLDSSEDRPRG